jgi:hypothetical protein
MYSLALSYWPIMAVVTANLSFIVTYIYIQGGVGGGPCSVVHGYRLRWSNHTAEARLTVPGRTVVCSCMATEIARLSVQTDGWVTTQCERILGQRAKQSA